MTFSVPGEPRGKGRPRFSRYTGKVYTDSETDTYEKKIVVYFRKACGGLKFDDGAFISVDVVAYLPIPKRATKANRASMEAGLILPSRKPDTDNIAKAVLDALNGVAYKDDARVQRICCSKLYGADPRLDITLQEVKEVNL